MMNNLRIFHAVLFLAIFLTGCLPRTWPPTWPQRTSRASSETRLTKPAFAPQDLNSSDFAGKIKELTSISKDSNTSNTEKAEAHRRLAILYLVPRNPDSNLKSATTELGKFLEIAPHKLDNLAAANWAAALKSEEEHQNLRNKVDALNKKNYRLAEEKTALASKNTELMKIIEKLKKLDLSLEEKRRNLR